MTRIRLTYTKAKEAAFISQADFILTIKEACVRAGVELIYTKDNEPDIVIASVLPLGIESVSEVCDIGIQEEDPTYVVKALNQVLPSGVIILSAEILPKDARQACDGIYASEYEILPEFDNLDKMTKKEVENLRIWYKEILREYMESPSMNVLVKSKDRNERIDVKPEILNYSIQINNALHVTVKTTPTSSLNPAYIMDGFNEYIDKKLVYSIRRIKILCE